MMPFQSFLFGWRSADEILVVIFSWVYMAEGRATQYWDFNLTTMTMLGAYGTMPMMVNL